MSNAVSRFFSGLQIGGKIALLLVAGGVAYGGNKLYQHVFPPAAKNAVITTKASSNLPPLAYDKSANAPSRPLPSDDPAEVQAPEIRGEVMGWNAQLGMMYGIGGAVTTKGSIAAELGLNIKVSVQNNTGTQGNDLYSFAAAYAKGDPNPSVGCHFIIWMGDGVPSYFTGLEARLKKDLGPDFIPEVVSFAGGSYGEDKWLIKKKFEKDARGSVNIGVIRDGDWDVAVIKSQLNGWAVNSDNTTYDRTKVNFIPAPNDDYMEAAKSYIAGQQVKLAIVENGRRTGKDTLVSISGVVTWFPGDLLAVQKKGGLVCIASTKDYGAQMCGAIIFIKAWAKANDSLVSKFVEMVGRGGDQVKSHEEALQLGAKVSSDVYKDEVLKTDDWYKGYKSYDQTDDDGNVVNIGGSRVFNLADAAAYTGADGGRDSYKTIYNTFGKIDMEAYPEVIKEIPDYGQVTDWHFLKDAYTRARGKGLAGNTSKVDFSSASKGAVAADANYSIQFKTGSATISPASYAVLDRVADRLSVASELLIEIAGHTDNTGDPSKNQELSQARAEAVRAYIVAKDRDGFGPRTKASGYGQDRPLNPSADQNSSDERAKNRRVEIKLNRTN